jgi:lipid-binding SYLF domain-containing protein
LKKRSFLAPHAAFFPNAHYKGGAAMKKHSIFVVVAALLMLGATSSPVWAENTAADARELIHRSRITFERFVNDKDLSLFQQNLPKAKGILIFPRILKAGFIWGGSGGTGVLVIRNGKTQGWSQPVFYDIGSVTFGFQIGAETAEAVMLAMNDRAVDTLLSSSFRLGGEASVAAAKQGVGLKKILTADFISFAKTKGLYAGLNFEGSLAKVDHDLIRAYYGKDMRPVEILLEHKAENPHSDELLKVLSDSR